MSAKEISQRLRALASDDTCRSKAARLRDVFEDVEAALEAGVAMSKVMDALERHGLKFTLFSFQTTLQRIRRKRGPRNSTGTANQAKNPASRQEIPSGEGSHDPAVLNRIISSKPDLASLAKHQQRGRKK